MKFFGNGIVWDAEISKTLCEFSRSARRHEKGVFETEDIKKIKKLINLGYEYEGVIPEEPEEVEETPEEVEEAPEKPEVSLDDLSYNQLKKLAKEKKIPRYFRMSANDLKKELSR